MAGVSLDSIVPTPNLDGGLDGAVDDRNERARLKQLYERYWNDLCRHIRIGSSKSDVRRQIVRALETIEAALEAYK